MAHRFIEHPLEDIQGVLGADSRHCGHRVQSSSAMKAYQQARASTKKKKSIEKQAQSRFYIGREKRWEGVVAGGRQGHLTYSKLMRKKIVRGWKWPCSCCEVRHMANQAEAKATKVHCRSCCLCPTQAKVV